MGKKLTIDLPLKQKVLKYVELNLPASIHHHQISSKSPLGRYILENISILPRKPKKPEHSITITIPSQYNPFGEKGFDGRSEFVGLTEKSIYTFNIMVEMMMRHELYARLELVEERGENHQRNGKMRAEIDNFIKKYSTYGTELNYETLKKGYQRYKSNRETRLQRMI